MEKIRNLKFFVLLMLVFVSITLHAYQNWDYATAQNGDWEDASTWKIYYSGYWYSAYHSPNGSTNIYINHYVKINTRTNVIKKNLTINPNGTLVESPQTFPCYFIFQGEELIVDGILGGNSSRMSLETGSTQYPTQYIMGNGEAILNRVELSGNVKWKLEANIQMARLNSGNVRFLDRPNTQIIFNRLWLVASDISCNIQTKCIVKKGLYLGYGNNFEHAPTLKLSGNAALLLYDHDGNRKEIFNIGYNNTHANLILSGTRYHKVGITSTNGGYWDFRYYQPSHYIPFYKNVKLSAKHAIFRNLEGTGLTISNLMQVENLVDCEFKFPRERYGFDSYLLNVGYEQFINLYNPTFALSHTPTSHNHNIKCNYFHASVGVHNATGNLAGESYEYDPYNRVTWYSRGGSKDDGDNITSLDNLQLTNYPNPFNPTTTISYQLKDKANIELAIYNSKGELVKNLVKEDQLKGNHSIVWNGNNNRGKKVTSGVYFYKLKINGDTKAIKKCVLMK